MVGRAVFISEMGDDIKRPPKRNRQAFDKLIDDICDLLSTDFGVVGNNFVVPGPAGTADLPKVIPASVWKVGRNEVEDYWIEVHQVPNPNVPPQVHANVQVTFKIDDLRDKFVSIVHEKDDPRNDILLITTGLVDNKGFVASTDSFLLPEIKNLISEGLTIEPTHLNQVIVHHWTTPNAVIAYERASSPLLVDGSVWK
jgi:hypothetical protein